MATIEDDEIDSADEAFLEMLGLPSMDVKVEVDADDHETESAADSGKGTGNAPQNPLERLNQRDVAAEFQTTNHNLQDDYTKVGVCLFPPSLSVPAALLRRLTEELVWGDSIQADKTYETITLMKAGEVRERRTLTRLENFVDHHPGWKDLCHNYLQRCISALMGQEMVLFKEKLNLKPPGGSGFAPHLDGPSLRVALGNNGPKTFVTVMVAIDNMTPQNGCLRIAKGPWSEDHTCEVVPPDADGSPDAGGRAGAIPATVADSLGFEDVPCSGGSIVAFGEWTPHRSASNTSHFPRRAVFLTYNPLSEGDFHAQYYEKMEAMRNEWRSKAGLVDRDYQTDLDALATIPK